MSIRLATFCTRHILEHGASTLDTLADASREAEITRARDPFTAVRTALRQDPRLIELPDRRWECGLRLLGGNVLTHRVRAATSGRDLVFLGDETAPLGVYLDHGPLRLSGGGELTTTARRRTAWGSPPAVVGPAGWLPDVAAGGLVGLAWSMTGLSVRAVQAADADLRVRAERVRDVLARHAPGRVRAGGLPGGSPGGLSGGWPGERPAPDGLARMVWSALIEVPDLFAEPVPPLDEVLDLPRAAWPSDDMYGDAYLEPMWPRDPDRHDRHGSDGLWPDRAYAVSAADPPEEFWDDHEGAGTW